MKRRILLLATLALPVLRASTARANPKSSFTLGPITLTHPWSAPAVTEVAALFVGITNNGPAPDRLIAGSTPVAGTVIFRSHDGSPLEYYDLWPKRPLDLAPGRRYIALRDLKSPLALDDTFPMTFHFAKAGAITVTAVVEAGPEDDSSF
jgi:hypothetical protein